MRTYREQQAVEYEDMAVQYDKLVQSLNARSAFLANETRFTHLRLYKEQVEQIEEIQAYFRNVGMSESDMTTEAVLTMALKEFYEFVQSLRTES
ncbi:hypothetical protein B0H94_102205 [Salsuginibacillus halophilus]|uniref:Uncharacterized protein n=1 Tax=Salsuginibacillus halophilus TaxID=517424 RepID=A0A2P8HXI8_9BACI|nr:hypothetical protein [Salsuginibacillus halophilus]PSL50928.1 hypothetical protein B0H94_102205 [Salsuginibacillus halophilus]